MYLSVTIQEGGKFLPAEWAGDSLENLLDHINDTESIEVEGFSFIPMTLKVCNSLMFTVCLVHSVMIDGQRWDALNREWDRIETT